MNLEGRKLVNFLQYAKSCSPVMHKLIITSFLAVTCTTIFTAKPNASSISLEKGDSAVTVKVDSELFTKYIYADKKRAKPILYPVIGPGGIPMTRRYPIEEAGPGEAKDHRHPAMEIEWLVQRDRCEQHGKDGQRELKRHRIGHRNQGNR